MNTRYMEVSSAYRNREVYPDVAEFEVLFSTASTNPYEYSYYAEAFPVYDFYIKYVNGLNKFFTTSDNVNPSISNPLTPVNITPDAARVYVGYQIQRTSFPFSSSIVTDFAGSTGTATLNYPLPSPPVDTAITPWVSQCNMTDPSPAGTYPWWGLGPAQSDCFVVQFSDIYGRTPFSGVNIFKDYYIVAEDAPVQPDGRAVYSTIYRYYPELRTVATAYKFPAPVTANTNRYSIRKVLPIQKNYTVVASPDPFRVQITPVVGLTPAQYINKIFYILPISPRFVPGDDPAVFPDTATNRMTFDQYAYRIVSYDAASSTITLDRKINDVLYNQSLPTYVPLVGRRYEILPEAKATTYPLKYSGSTVSQADVSCYDVALVDLLLPNVPLTTGSRIVEYPYVYVEVRTDGNDFRLGQNIITSNNPNATHALFVCAVTNIVDPSQATFVKIDASSMLQTIKFKPNSSMFFRVYLPDGTLFRPFQVDNPSPLPANPLLQVQCTFALTR